MTDKILKEATYTGPENELEPSDYLVVNGVRLPRDTPVLVDAETAKLAEEVEGHTVEIADHKKDDDDVPAAPPTATTPPATGGFARGGNITPAPGAPNPTPGDDAGEK
jgi:hypothetical protein